MRGRTALILVAAVLMALVAWAEVWDPTFLRWLDPEDPDDQTILVYWERFAAGDATPLELVDLGTLLAERDTPLGGYPKDAIRLFKLALDEDPDLAEAWFRIGLLQHRRGDWSAARKSYEKCVKVQADHGWSLFYLGLLQEQMGDTRGAVEHYQAAFTAAPSLADPANNPELLYARLAVGARIGHGLASRTGGGGLATFLEADKVNALHDSFLPEPEELPPPVEEPEFERPSPVIDTPAPEPEGVSPTPTRTAPPRPAPEARTSPVQPPDPTRMESLKGREGFRRGLSRPQIPGGGGALRDPVKLPPAPTPAPDQ